MHSSSGLSSTTNYNVGWSETARKTANNLTKKVRSKLNESGVMNIERPIKIKAERLSTTSTSSSSTPNNKNHQDAETTTTTATTSNNSKVATITKVIHFQRHAQGYHNLIGDMHRELNLPIDFDSTDPSKNPFVRPEIVDSPLTETGREQSKARREQASQLKPQLVIVSPLCRAIQTALLSFADHRPCYSSEDDDDDDDDDDNTIIPWIAHEGCREELGLLICNKRRILSHTKEEYPMIDFSLIQSEHDNLFNHNKRESALEKSERAYTFLTEFIRNRPEEEIAVVCHSAWLFHVCNAVMDCGGDEELMSWFLTSEIRSMRVTFEG